MAISIVEETDLTTSFMADLTAYSTYALKEKLTQTGDFKFPSIAELVDLTLELIFQELPIPSKINQKKLRIILSTQIQNNIKNDDSELGSIINELGQYENVPESFDEFKKFAKIFNKFVEKSASLMETTITQSIGYLYGSDIPYSIIAKLVLTEYTMLTLIQFIDEEGRKIAQLTSKSRTSVRQKRISKYRRIINKLGESSFKTRLCASRLRLFIHLSNIESENKLFTPTFLSYSAINKMELSQLIMNLDRELSNLRSQLLKESISIFEQYPRKPDIIGQTLWSEFVLLRVE